MPYLEIESPGPHKFLEKNYLHSLIHSHFSEQFLLEFLAHESQRVTSQNPFGMLASIFQPALSFDIDRERLKQDPLPMEMTDGPFF